MVRFVTIAKFCELTGFTPAAVYTRRCKGVWLEGSVWRYAPGSKTILMDVEGYERWVEDGTDPQSPRTQPMKSPRLPRLSQAPRAAKRSPCLPPLER